MGCLRTTPPCQPALYSRGPMLRFGRGPRGGGRYVAVETKRVAWIVAVFECDEALPVLLGVGGLDAFGRRSVELEEIDVGGAGLVRTGGLGHVGEVRLDLLGYLGCRGYPDPVHDELRVVAPDRAQVGGGAIQRAAELAQLEQGQRRARAGAGNLHERDDGVIGEVPQQFDVPVGRGGIRRVHADRVQLCARHRLEAVYEGLTELAPGTHKLLASLRRVSTKAGPHCYHGLPTQR